MNAEICTGAAPMPMKDLGAVRNTVVCLLTSCAMENKSHVLVMDQFYNSVTLAKYALSELHTGIVGTLQQNEKQFIKSLKSVKKLALYGVMSRKCNMFNLAGYKAHHIYLELP